MGPTGTVEQVVLARWGVRLIPAPGGRFAEPGWSYEEPVARQCPTCGDPLHSLRKPYVSAGRHYRYTALVCPACPSCLTLGDLGLRSYDQVMRPVDAATGSPAAPPAGPAPTKRRPASPEAARREGVLRFWRSVELFGAQTLDRPDPRERRYAPLPGELLPWQDGRSLRQPDGTDRVWRHTVHGGVFALDQLHTTLESVFGPSGMDVDERTPRGESALFAVVVTGDGRLLLDSLILSTAAWATGRTRNPGPARPEWLDGFPLAAEAHADAVRKVVAAAADDQVASSLAQEGILVSRPITHDTLLELVELTAELLGVTDLLAPAGIRVQSDFVSRRRAYDTQLDFLNSFYVDDLRRVADAVADGDCGEALAAYLAEDGTVAEITRLDVRDPRSEDLLIDRLAPARVPAGRWPARSSHPLATSQQLAINTIVAQLGERAGAFAVNGPPGTGKTTMLRDLVAALVVDRAKRLAQLRTPGAAFAGDAVGWRSDRYQRWIRPLRDELTGFEMVVASANNGAVANVTREIPQLKAVDDAWSGEAVYLREHANRVLGAPAWGLIAAALGNKANRTEFVSRFWYGEPADRAHRNGEEGPGFLDWLRTQEPVEGGDWGAAVTSFRAALADEQQLRDVRQGAYEALRRLPELERANDAAQRELVTATAESDRARVAAQAAEGSAAIARHSAHAARERRREHRDLKPGLWEILFTVGRAIRRWHAEDEQLAAEAATAEATATAAGEHATRARQAAVEAARRLATVSGERNRAEQSLLRTRAVLDEAYRLCGDQVPDPVWRAAGDRREAAGPWLDAQWNTARTRLFLAALALHHAFITGAAQTLRANLQATMDILTGQVPSDAPEGAVRAAWQTLFLVVPVVSTTFASVGRLLGRLGRESLGWLLIDEAGQAAPQMAVGAIWRARRVVAVGDPLQLEPVVTVPHTTQAALRRHHGVADTWLPGRTSVQALADRITPIGTWLPGPDDVELWVGAPLRVHRRCDNPMFGVVNTAVYAGLMIHAVPVRTAAVRVVESTWIDVVSAEAEGHWLPDEGYAAAETIGYLVRCGVSPADVLVVSPFRDVARRLRRLLAAPYPGLTCGTVHVAQGREAEVVLFVLGGNPARPGARTWAAQRPNLFNVAVSRARQRIYVIGNHDSWAKLPYFSVLARSLPVRPFKSSGPPDPGIPR